MLSDRVTSAGNLDSSAGCLDCTPAAPGAAEEDPTHDHTIHKGDKAADFSVATDVGLDEWRRGQQPQPLEQNGDLPSFFIGPDPSDCGRSCWRQATIMMRSFPPTTLAPCEGCAGVAAFTPQALLPPLPPEQEVSCQL